MAARRIVVPVDINAGMDAGTDPKVATGLIVAENAVYDREGALSMRDGTLRGATDYTTKYSRISAYGLSAFLWGSTVSTGSSCARYLKSGDTAIDMVAENSQRPYRHELTNLPTATNPVGWADVIEGSDFIAALWIDGDDGSLHLSTYDLETGIKISTAELSATVAGTPNQIGRLALVDSVIYAYYIEASTPQMERRTLTAGGTISGATTVTTNSTPYVAGGTIEIDVCVIGDTGSQYAAIIYKGASNVEAVILDGGTVGHASFTVSSSLPDGDALGIFTAHNGNDAVYMWSDEAAGTNTVSGRGMDIDGTQTVSLTTLYSYTTGAQDALRDPLSLSGIAFARADAPANGVATIYITAKHQDHNGLGQTNEVSAVVELCLEDSAGTGSVNSSFTTKYPYMEMASKPFWVNETNNVPAFLQYFEAWGLDFVDGSHQGQYILTSPTENYTSDTGQIIPFVPVGRFRPGLARSESILTTAHVRQSSGWSLGIRRLVRRTVDETTIDGSGVAQIHHVEKLDIVDDSSSNTLEREGSLFIGGSMPMEADGTRLFEHGWATYPEPVFLQAKTGGSLTSSATYGYRVVYEHVDALGKRHQSPVSPGWDTDTLTNSFVTMGAAETRVTVILSAPPHTARGPDIAFAIYRSKANEPSGPFYRVASVQVALAVAEFPFIGYNDDAADTDIEDNEQLIHGVSGILDDGDPPPSYLASTFYRNRHFTVGLEDGRIYYSKPFVDGQPVMHNVNLVVDHNVDAIPAALGELNNRLAIFMPDGKGIYATQGDGLDNTGAGANLISPYLAVAALGATSQRTTVRYPGGIAFEHSDGGIYALLTSLQPEKIGERVRFYTDTLTLTDAVVHQNRSELLFLTSDDDALVYNYLRNKWSKHQWADNSVAQAGGAVVNDVLHRLHADGTNAYVWYDNPGTAFVDDDGTTEAAISMRLFTGYLAPAVGTGGVSTQGSLGLAKRLWRLIVMGQSLNDESLQAQVRYDYGGGGPAAVNFASTLSSARLRNYYPPNTHATETEDNTLIIHGFPEETRCSCARVELTVTSTASGFQEAPVISSIHLEFGIHPTVFRVGEHRHFS